tara:strand:+ start:79 stop:912 length:834 start_codon:yes stop_codon:yes gene_type:complete
MSSCGNCGAALKKDPSIATWECEFCKLVTVNERYAEYHIKDIETSKSHSQLQVGLASFEAGDYKKALDILEKSLMDDSRNIDAWVYSSLCIANLIDLSNISASIKKITSYFNSAREIDEDAEIIKSGETLSRNAIGKNLLRAIEKQASKAEKQYFAFESIDKSQAIQRRNEELQKLFQYAEQMFEMPSEIPTVIGPASVAVLLAERKIHCHVSLSNAAKATLEVIKTTHPDYYKKVTAPLHVTEKSGCLGSVAVLFLGVLQWFVVLMTPFIFIKFIF